MPNSVSRWKQDQRECLELVMMFDGAAGGFKMQT